MVVFLPLDDATRDAHDYEQDEKPFQSNVHPLGMKYVNGSNISDEVITGSRTPSR